jgi:hypothetical protein
VRLRRFCEAGEVVGNWGGCGSFGSFGRLWETGEVGGCVSWECCGRMWEDVGGCGRLGRREVVGGFRRLWEIEEFLGGCGRLGDWGG